VALGWKRIARRIRVPLGFVFAVFYFWLARPSWLFLGLSLILVAPGLLLRGYASGYVKKNAELTTTGPYAHTRNPLYLGSMLIAAGFAVAARSYWIAGVLIVLFLAIYIPVIRGEEEHLRSVFPDFDAYAARVPRLIPRITPARQPGETGGVFSAALYRKHRETNALLGAAAMYAALILKLILAKR
jgi:protein-S-isoprenylcysteine O-methyltransferase Ste14